MASCCFVLIFLINCFCISNTFADEKSDFEIKITKAPAENCKREAAKNDFLSVHYTGKLKESGKEFDSSRTRNKPHEFVLGVGAVIEGWERGIKGMCIGEQRQLIIPPDLAYGDHGYGDIIPPKSTLLFDVELLDIKEEWPDWLKKAMKKEEVEIEITKEPPKDCTRKAQDGDRISVHYDGYLKVDGTEFDSSRKRGQPFDVVLGLRQVIAGWEQGLKGMCVGEQRKLTIPPELAYGDRGYGDIIPPKSTLLFDVELMGIKDSAEQEEKKEEKDSAVEIEVLKEPPKDCTKKAQDGDHIKVHYDGYLKGGKEFDSSRKRNQPFDVILGRRQVIIGWEKGLQGMCVGEQRRLTIPPELAYGDQGFGDIIPAKSTLVFDVQLLAFVDVHNEHTKVGIEIKTPPPENCKRKAQENDQVSVHYVGFHKDGQEFDSSRKRKEPLVVVLGKGQVIPGWEQGITGMCVGEERKLTIPPELAYGDNGIGDIIPGGSTLIFDVELMDIQDAPVEDSRDGQQQQPEDTFELIDTNNDRTISWEEMAAHVKLRPQESDGDTPTETIVSEIFQEDDKNKDGVISYDEFFGSVEQQQPYSTEVHEEL